MAYVGAKRIFLLTLKANNYDWTFIIYCGCAGLAYWRVRVI